MAEIALFFLNNDTRANKGIVFQAVPAFEKQDSKVIVFLQHNRVNSQLLDLGGKVHAARTLFRRFAHGGSSRAGGGEAGSEIGAGTRAGIKSILQ
jgi:hypothetical protein